MALARTSLQKNLRYGIEAALFLSFIGFLKMLGLERASTLGAIIAKTIGPKLKITKRAHTNLKLCFPDMSQEQRDVIIVNMYENLGRTVGEYAHFDKFYAFREGARITVTGEEQFEHLKALGTSVIYVSGHFANWELLPVAAKDYGLSGIALYRAVNNPYIDKWLVQKRTKYIFREQVAKGPDSPRKIAHALKTVKPVMMLIDQKMNDGIPVPFFGRLAMTTPAAALFSLNRNVPIVPVSMRRVEGSNFHVHVNPPVQFTATGKRRDDIKELMHVLNEWLETEIREQPEQWLWLHRRWPESRPDVIPDILKPSPES